MILIALDISAAFDMVMHSTLLRRLSYSFGIDDAALRWIKSYLSECSQFVQIGIASLKPTVRDCGVPQGLALGPIFFTVYTSPVAKVADAHGIVQQQYADDMQLYIAMSKMLSTNAIVQIQNCVTALHQWFAENGLALNPDKSEAVLFSTSERAKGLSFISTIDAAGSTVALSSKIKLLGMMLDGNLNFNDQVKNVCRASSFHIRALRHIPSLSEEMANIVACALVQSQVDYANSLNTGMSSVNFDKLQLVQNTLAHVVALTRKWDHIPAIFQETASTTNPSTCRFQGCTVDIFN